MPQISPALTVHQMSLFRCSAGNRIRLHIPASSLQKRDDKFREFHASTVPRTIQFRLYEVRCRGCKCFLNDLR